MTRPILYSFRRCPYAMRARMALCISETGVETREVLLRDKPPQMLEVSPKGTVPVLVQTDGSVLDESLDIMRWALARNDPENWLADDDEKLIAANDGPFKHHLDRYKYSTRHDSDPEEHREAGQSFLNELEKRLSSQPHLTRETRSFADIAIFPFVRQFANTDRTWFDALPLPGVQGWLANLLQSRLFADIMVKRERWTG